MLEQGPFFSQKPVYLPRLKGRCLLFFDNALNTSRSPIVLIKKP